MRQEKLVAANESCDRKAKNERGHDQQLRGKESLVPNILKPKLHSRHEVIKGMYRHRNIEITDEQ